MGISDFFHPPNGHNASAKDMVQDGMNILYFYFTILST